MSNHVITPDNVPPTQYLVARLCKDCMERDPEMSIAAPIPMPFPSVSIAKGFLNGLIESIQNGERENETWDYETNTSLVIDEEGEKHVYTYGVIKMHATVAYNFGDDENISSKFDDIVQSLFDQDNDSK